MNWIPALRSVAYIALAAVAILAVQRFGLTLQGIGIAVFVIGLGVLMTAIGRVETNAATCRECGTTMPPAHGFCIMCGRQPV